MTGFGSTGFTPVQAGQELASFRNDGVSTTVCTFQYTPVGYMVARAGVGIIRR